MKKFKKVFTVLLTLAMVLGMCITSSAQKVTDKYANDITVKNLTARVDTDVRAYNIIYLDCDETGNETWEIVEWAKNYVAVNSTNGEFEITNKEGLKSAVESQNPDVQQTVSGAECTFKNLPIGAYVIWANDAKSTYELMVANTYDENEKYLASKSTDVIAKVGTYTVDKEADDYFVHRGETVTFTVTTQFPAKSKTNTDGTVTSLNSFKITDAPKGLLITGLPTVTIAENEVSINNDMVTNTLNEDKTETTAYEVNLSSFINTFQAGSTVVVQYTATVVDDHKYSNSANAESNTVNYTPDSTEGFEGNITVTKINEEKKTLTGAEFQIYKGEITEENTPLKFVALQDGSGYKLALDATETDATDTVAVDNNGRLVLTGLDEGTYYIKETLAPEGYSLAEESRSVTIAEGNSDQEVSMSTDFVNTKLSSLPSTGGIGTTIFTIGGCAIMIIAAALFFASRRKASK